jgi:uncharacterized protein (TIGR02271 family)
MIASPDNPADAKRVDADGRLVLPEIEEHIDIGVEAVETGRVVLRKRVEVERESADVDLTEYGVEVERVAVNEVVDAAHPPKPRREGETLIYPVLEEVVVLERRLMLKEEVRVTQRQQVRHETVEVDRRVEHIDAQRRPPE